MTLTIPIMRPKLPSLEQLARYLEQIDSSRIYSNFGPLALALEDRLAAHYGLGVGTVTTVANATLGLTLALTAQGARPGTLCILPAWTFVASAHAATMAGLIPYFVDVDSGTWMLDTTIVSNAIARAPATVGAVMPVAPFGRPIETAAWDRFRSQNGLPVVIDAAAGFDSIAPGETPVVVSLHATKVIGTGEGGFVMSTDTSLVRSVRTRTNFGFDATRQATVPSVNAKLSEYHAAVGLAALDDWDTARNEWMVAAAAYRKALRESDQLRFQDGFGENWVASTCILRLADAEAERMEREFASAGVETRRWWGQGAHAHPATRKFARTAVPVTEALAHSTLSVPIYRDVTTTQINQVARCIRAAM